MDNAHLLTLVNARHETTFELVGRYATGEQGAFAIADHGGRRAVLKWEPDAGQLDRVRDAAIMTARLRERGYPAPRYLAIGSVAGAGYSIQETLPGAPQPVVPAALIPRILELNLLQRGQSTPERREWPARVVKPVLYGGDGFCLLEPLRAYSSATSELLDTLQTLVSAHANDHVETGDIVHFDFNPANILIDDGEIGGVIDWQDPCTGDRAFDLVTLLFCCYDTLAVREQLWHYLTERIASGVLGAYVAHMILRQVDWSIRFHTPEDVEHWLRISHSALRDVQRHANGRGRFH